ncbi:unnamed protein product [Ranitomeya imitator]|uniref:TSC22 domain family protein 3 n=2 Tax=Ranitomeya imitator TaxID=111125 RepID=A0ABN9M717_9NEOB|nr:unnamed protein product [Ranitomeya imitator]
MSRDRSMERSPERHEQERPVVDPRGRRMPQCAGPAVAPSVRAVYIRLYPGRTPADMSTGLCQFPMEVAVYELHNFSISFFSSLLGADVVSVKLDNSASGASVVAIDNKIEQAMDLVKNHLMYAVREEVEVLKEQIKELVEKNSQLERENCLLKNLASPEQMKKFQSRLPSGDTRVISSLDFLHATQPRKTGSAV